MQREQSSEAHQGDKWQMAAPDYPVQSESTAGKKNCGGKIVNIFNNNLPFVPKRSQQCFHLTNVFEVCVFFFLFFTCFP